MTSRARSPCSHAIVCADKIIARVDSVVAVCQAPDVVPVDKSATIATSMMSAQRVREGGGWRGEEGWGEWAGRPLCE